MPNCITLAFGTGPAPALAPAVKPFQTVGAKMALAKKPIGAGATKTWLVPDSNKLPLEPFLPNVFQKDFRSTRGARVEALLGGTGAQKNWDKFRR